MRKVKAMITLRLFLEGERYRDSETGRIDFEKGPLFCEIEFIGDGTPGDVRFYSPETPHHSREDLGYYRLKVERGLAQPARNIFTSGGSVTDGKSVLYYDQTTRFEPWTKDHIINCVVLPARSFSKHEWEGLPPFQSPE